MIRLKSTVSPKLSPKDLNLLKGALRRSFARSEVYRARLALNAIEHHDPEHPRCQHWVWCDFCGVVFPRWQAALDHQIPVVPIERRADEMEPTELLLRIWCGPENLNVLDPLCHSAKTKAENALRPKRYRQKKIGS